LIRRAGAIVQLLLIVAAAQAAPTTPQKDAAIAAIPAVRQLQISFREMGLGGPLELRGIEGIGAVNLGVRADEVVTAAKLRLRMTHSPALLPELSHLRISLNGQVLAAIPLSKEQSGREIIREIPLDAQYFTDYNQLRFDFIGHYTLECEEPKHTSLWASISDRSEIELQVRPLELRNELGLLPAPFFDRRDNRRLVLPIVLPPHASRALLRSAGVAASWFGMLADYRSARFPVIVGRPPQQHALVFATNALSPAGLTLPQVTSPTLSIVDSPADPRVKLLVFQGKDEAELRQAVEGLILGNPVLAGSTATISAVHYKRRTAYDAPRWLPSDRAVEFGELVENSQELQASGYSPQPIRINMRLAPDLFTWNFAGVPIDLRYRFTPPLDRDNSTLTLSINNQLIKTIRLRPDNDTGAAGKLLVPLIQGHATQDTDAFLIPAFQVGSNNQIQMQFAHEYHQQGLCKQQPLDNARAAIDPNSSIDLSAFPHYTAMPNLALFANAGYPFTRYADLAETAIVLSDTEDTTALEQMFFVLGRMGRQTGAAAVAYRLIDTDEALNTKDADLLVLGGSRSKELLARWGEDLALVLRGDDRRFRQPELARRYARDPNSVVAPAGMDPDATLRASGSVGAMMGFESPLSGGRSVVAFVGSDNTAENSLLDVIEDEGKVGAVAGDLTIVRGADVQSFRGGSTYYVGTLSWWKRIWFHVSRHPLLLSFLALLLAISIAVWCYGWLQRRAARRLAGHAA
jgi:cellulose synthase operon protein B